MKNLCFLLIAVLFFPLSAFSQGENDNWAFGYYNLIEFSTGNPSVQTCNINTFEGGASISDALGNLLFFTDGERVWNDKYDMMLNGCCLTAQGGDYDPKDSSTEGGSTAQGAVIVPHPGDPYEYFIFTTNGPSSTYDFCAYSKVDMLADYGKGDVVLKNVPLKDHTGSLNWNDTTEGITVIDDYDNYWVLIPYEGKLLAYYVDENGVNTTPVVSSIVPTTNHVQIKVSPNKAHLAIVDFGGWNYCLLYDFNANTGTIVGNPFVFQSQTPVYSVEFSSQNNMLWFTTNYPERIYGYDINNLSQNPVVFNTNKNYGTLQRRPNGKIYVTLYNSNFLAEINNPNSLSATFIDQAIPLIGTSTYGLPQLIPPPVCVEDLILTHYEQADITYETSNSITTKTDYVACGYDVVLSAGNFVELLPNTFLCADLNYVLVEIGGCLPPSPRPAPVATNHKTNIIYVPTGNLQLSRVVIYPNPVIDVLNIGLPNEMKIKSAVLYNLMGRQMETFLIGNTMNMSNFSSGFYILKLETNQGTLTKKVIKQ